MIVESFDGSERCIKYDCITEVLLASKDLAMNFIVIGEKAVPVLDFCSSAIN